MSRISHLRNTFTRFKRSQPTLRLLVVVSFSGVALALVALLSLIIGQISARQLEQDARQSLTVLATEMADRIEHELYDRYSEIRIIAATDVTLRMPTASAPLKALPLDELQKAHPDYAWIGVTDTDGKVVAATQNLLVGTDLSDREWFQAAKTAPYFGDVHESSLLAPLLTNDKEQQASLRFVDFAAPIFNDQNQLVGVLGAYVDWRLTRQLKQALLRSVAVSHNVGVFISDQNGTPLLTPDDWEGTLPTPTSLDLTIGSGATVSTWPDGKRYVTSFAAIRPSALPTNLQWLILVRQPIMTAYAPAWRTQWQIFVIGALAAALFALFAWWIASRITRQLVALTEVTEAIRSGQGGTIPVLLGTKEVATLSTSLNQLIGELTTAREAERNRIARELHDSVTQTLFSTSMLADVLPKLWESDPELGRTKLEELRRAVRGALAEMRTLLLELRPAAIADADIRQLMRQLADSTTGRTGVNVTWRIEGEVAPAAERKVVIYRTMQEALNNIVKHAEATTARLLLRCADGSMELVIADDGHGFQQDLVTGDHFGLKMMRERIEASGGTLRIESQPDEGTEIHAHWVR